MQLALDEVLGAARVPGRRRALAQLHAGRRARDLRRLVAPQPANDAPPLSYTNISFTYGAVTLDSHNCSESRRLFTSRWYFYLKIPIYHVDILMTFLELMV